MIDPLKETWGQWFRRNVDQHHSEYMLISIFIFGLLWTLHVSHDGGTDKDLVSFGREITSGAAACLYGFMRGQAKAESSQPQKEHSAALVKGLVETTGEAPKKE